jgi:transmembrane sensor
MNNDSKSSFHDADVDAQAAGWVMRRDRGLNPGEQDDYLRWLAADPRHGEHFARHERAWRRLDPLVQWRPEHSPQPNPDLLAPRARRRGPGLPLWLAAAAMIAWALLAGWPRNREPGATKVPAVEAGPIVAQDYETRVLPDGSLIELKRGAAVEVDYMPGERDVRLVRGEAQFTVANNPGRPFVVAAGGVGVRAVGTAFDVKLAGPEVEVLVTEGRVQVIGGSAARALAKPLSAFPIAAGQKATFSSDPAAPPPREIAVSSDQIERSLSWRPALLTFTHAPLSEIVAGFNVHNGVQLVVADPQTAALKLDLTFHSNNVDAFVRMLAANYGVGVHSAGDTITLGRD